MAHDTLSSFNLQSALYNMILFLLKQVNNHLYLCVYVSPHICIYLYTNMGKGIGMEKYILVLILHILGGGNGTRMGLHLYPFIMRCFNSYTKLE